MELESREGGRQRRAVRKDEGGEEEEEGGKAWRERQERRSGVAFTGTSPRTSQGTTPSLQAASARSLPPWAEVFSSSCLHFDVCFTFGPSPFVALHRFAVDCERTTLVSLSLSLHDHLHVSPGVPSACPRSGHGLRNNLRPVQGVALQWQHASHQSVKSSLTSVAHSECWKDGEKPANHDLKGTNCCRLSPLLCCGRQSQPVYPALSPCGFRQPYSSNLPSPSSYSRFPHSLMLGPSGMHPTGIPHPAIVPPTGKQEHDQYDRGMRRALAGSQGKRVKLIG
ncbi:hypothetical protein INR49_005960 [Caranx melampygus]|nr:hypothetical protein INR49_005960 [Caranx melampygus]